MPNTYYELNVMFRDSGNYKDTGIVIVDAETYNNIKGAMFETFGEEVEYIRAYHDQKKVWTLLEADGKQYISAGYHRVNRLGYFITEIAWEAGTEEFYSE